MKQEFILKTLWEEYENDLYKNEPSRSISEIVKSFIVTAGKEEVYEQFLEDYINAKDKVEFLEESRLSSVIALGYLMCLESIAFFGGGNNKGIMINEEEIIFSVGVGLTVAGVTYATTKFLTYLQPKRIMNRYVQLLESMD